MPLFNMPVCLGFSATALVSIWKGRPSNLIKTKLYVISESIVLVIIADTLTSDKPEVEDQKSVRLRIKYKNYCFRRNVVTTLDEG